MLRKVFFWVFLIVSFLTEIYFVYQGQVLLNMPSHIYYPAFFGVCLGLSMVVITLYFTIFKGAKEEKLFLVGMFGGALLFAISGNVFSPTYTVIGEQNSTAQLVNGQSIVQSLRSFNENKITIKVKGEDGEERLISYFKDSINQKGFLRSDIRLEIVADGENVADFRYVWKKVEFSFLGMPVGQAENDVNELYVTLHVPNDGKDVINKI